MTGKPVPACRWYPAHREPVGLKKGTRDPFEWYGKGRREDIPRIVVGKYLKLAYQQHEALGGLDKGGSGPDGKVHLSDLMVAFEGR